MVEACGMPTPVGPVLTGFRETPTAIGSRRDLPGASLARDAAFSLEALAEHTLIVDAMADLDHVAVAERAAAPP